MNCVFVFKWVQSRKNCKLTRGSRPLPPSAKKKPYRQGLSATQETCKKKRTKNVPSSYLIFIIILTEFMYVYLVCGNTMCVSTCQVEFVLRELLNSTTAE